jgi:predicted RecB family nuclease
MSESRPAPLSKSRVLAGHLCPKRLYLQMNAPELAADPDAARRYRFEQGHEVGRHAQRAFPGGVALAAGRARLDDAVAQTAALLRDPTVPAIFEATFRHDDVLVRVDVLARVDHARWRLIEVKSTTSVKLYHPIDVAIQRHVVESCGVRLDGVALMHLNRDYVYPGGEPDAQALFTVRDITEEVRALDGVVPTLCVELRRVLAAEAPPPIPTGPQCKKPWLCDFFDHCNLPPLLPYFVPGVAGAVLAPELPDALARLAYPLYGMDFETLGPPIPRFPGMRPYQAIPFQWSVDVVRAPGAAPEHREFLALHEADPRREFLDSLAKAVGEEGPIVVYSGYEGARLAELAAALADLAPVAERIRARLWDFLPVMRRHVAHPAFGGSFSLKKVLPALAPGLGYEDLEISDGSLAGIIWDRLVRERPPREEAARLEAALRAYCQRDTQGLLALVRELAR